MDYKILVNKQKDFFQSGSTKNYSFRICQLKTLKSNIIKHQDDILNSLYADLGKSNSESYLTEVGLVLKEISFHIKHLKK